MLNIQLLYLYSTQQKMDKLIINANEFKVNLINFNIVHNES